MKVYFLITFASLAYAQNIDQAKQLIGTYGYIKKYAIPLGDRIRVHEEAVILKISNETISKPRQFPYQAGLLINYIDTSSIGVCGGSVISPSKVLTAAHCWYDGETEGNQFTIVLGSIRLFSGGTRLTSSYIMIHPQWNPGDFNYDVGVIYLPHSVIFSDTISSISMPSGSELKEDFAEEVAIASGFGIPDDSNTTVRVLRHISLDVITNEECGEYLPNTIQRFHMCAIGLNSINIGDSGGPLAVTRYNEHLQIGITAYSFEPSSETNKTINVFVRVSSLMNFIRRHM